jgi:hypothetical protein
MKLVTLFDSLLIYLYIIKGFRIQKCFILLGLANQLVKSVT